MATVADGGVLERLLNMVDSLYRKYGVELDAEDIAVAQTARNAALERLAEQSDAIRREKNAERE